MKMIGHEDATCT